MSRAAWAGAVLLVALLLATPVRGDVEWIQLDTTIPEGPDVQADDPADLVDLWYSANATHVFFREDLVAVPEPDNYTYVVSLDKPAGGDYDQDYRLVYAQSGAYVEAWDGASWSYVEDLTASVSGTSLVFEVPTDALGGWGEAETRIGFENHAGADAFDAPEDQAPTGGGGYLITRRTIPNLPGIVLPLFVAALGTALGLLVWRRTRAGEESL